MNIIHKISQEKEADSPSLFASAAAAARKEILFSIKKNDKNEEAFPNLEDNVPTEQQIFKFLGMNNMNQLFKITNYLQGVDEEEQAEKKDFVSKNITAPLYDYISNNKLTLDLYFKIAIYLKKEESNIEAILNKFNSKIQDQNINTLEDPEIKELKASLDLYETRYQSFEDRTALINMDFEKILLDVLEEYEKLKNSNLKFISRRSATSR